MKNREMFGDRISLRQLSSEIGRIRSSDLNRADQLRDEFDAIIDHKVGIYCPSDTRELLHAVHEDMRARIASIDSLFESMLIDADEYRVLSDRIINEAVDYMHAVLRFPIFDNSYVVSNTDLNS